MLVNLEVVHVCLCIHCINMEMHILYTDKSKSGTGLSIISKIQENKYFFIFASIDYVVTYFSRCLIEGRWDVE